MTPQATACPLSESELEAFATAKKSLGLLQRKQNRKSVCSYPPGVWVAWSKIFTQLASDSMPESRQMSRFGFGSSQIRNGSSRVTNVEVNGRESIDSALRRASIAAARAAAAAGLVFCASRIWPGNASSDLRRPSRRRAKRSPSLAIWIRVLLPSKSQTRTESERLCHPDSAKVGEGEECHAFDRRQDH